MAGRKRKPGSDAKNRIRCLELFHQRIRPDKDYKLQRGCDLCGYNAVADALQYHHRDPSTKEGHVSAFARTADPRYESERDKCNLLCSNCHWMITAPILI